MHYLHIHLDRKGGGENEFGEQCTLSTKISSLKNLKFAPLR